MRGLGAHRSGGRSVPELRPGLELGGWSGGCVRLKTEKEVEGKGVRKQNKAWVLGGKAFEGLSEAKGPMKG